MVVLENNRVICHGIDLNIHLILHILHSVLAGSVNLRAATQRVGVLHSDLSLSRGIFASLQQSEEISGRSHLAAVGAYLMNSRIQGVHHTVLGLEA